MLLKRLVPTEHYYAHDDWDRRTENVCEEDMEIGNGHAHCMSMLLGPRASRFPCARASSPRPVAARALPRARPRARPALARPGRRRLRQARAKPRPYRSLRRDVGGGQAAVDDERRAVDERRLVAREEERRVHDLARLAEAARSASAPAGARTRPGSSPKIASRSGVSTGPGQSAFTRTPSPRELHRRARGSSPARRPSTPCTRSARSRRRGSRRTRRR